MIYNKVYINIPNNAEAGGVESLYQLTDAINNIYGNAFVLFDDISNNPVPEKYKKYNIQYTNIVDDNIDNIIILPEVWTERIDWYKNIKKAIWWLSVENNHKKFQDFLNPNILHFYQSHYALSYLINNSAPYYLPLFDYIYDNNINYNIEDKQNIICYNPAKGKEITNILINQNSDIKFVPLINMSTQEIINTLKTSKIYIDFGHHPGKDRIPREAALLGNCVITSFKGSAMFYNDVNIDLEYKFNDIDGVRNKILEIFNNFTFHHNNFSLYKNIINNQKEQLYNQVKQNF